MFHANSFLLEKFAALEKQTLKTSPTFILIHSIDSTVSDPLECDMRLTEEQVEMLFPPARNGLVSLKYRWPNKTLPYTLPKNLSKPQKIQIELALRTMESISCVKFVERNNQTDYVEVRVCQSISLFLVDHG